MEPGITPTESKPSILKQAYTFFLKTINLSDGTDVRGTIDSIRKSIAIRGYNVWILACGALLASIGLDTNSDAVIIGAMLISPLMSPILGIGLSVGINDRDHLILALENFGVAVAACLFMSTLYFLITPFGVPTDAILARTKPTLMDVGVAIFGGIAGIVAGSRKDKTNAIPGVAIATALMPPLCVAGFGIAKMDWEVFFGAFYLFFLNSFFIALSTYMIVRFLNFPYMDFIDERSRKKVIRWISIFVILVIVPSAYFMVQILTEMRTNKAVDTFIEREINTDTHEAFERDLVQYNDSLRYLKIYVAGEDYISEDSVESIKSRLASNRYLSDVELRLYQTIVPAKELEEIKNEASAEVKMQQSLLAEKQAEIDTLRKTMQDMKADTVPFSALCRKVKALYPDMESFSYSIVMETQFGKGQDTLPLAMIHWRAGLRNSEKRKYRGTLTNYLREELTLDTLKLVEY